MQDPMVQGPARASTRELRHADTPLVRGGRAVVRWAQRFLYERVMDVRLDGQNHVPKTGGFIAASNHASHLDAGLVKMALGGRGEQMRALAASDYFFAQPWSRWYFENFTNVLPLERHGDFRASLKRAVRLLRTGAPMLVFPEGTRSCTGRMAPFKPAISSMALLAGCPIVPIYLSGTFEALPKGGGMLPRVRRIGARVGPALTAPFLRAWTAHLPRHEAHRRATALVELAVRSLQRGEALSPEALVSRYEAARQTLAQAASNQDCGQDEMRGIA